MAVASTPMTGRTAPPDTGNLRSEHMEMLRRRIELLTHPSSVEATIDALLHGAAP